MVLVKKKPGHEQSGSVLRLAVALCINGRYQEAVYVIAVVCSTWSSMNANTSQRDVLTPYGNTALSGVRAANRMVARWGTETNVYHDEFLMG